MGCGASKPSAVVEEGKGDVGIAAAGGEEKGKTKLPVSPGPAEPDTPAPATEQEAAEEEKKIAAQRAKPRRPGVSAEPVTVDPDFKPPVHEKDPEAREKLVGMLKANRDCQVLIGHLGEQSFSQIVDAFFPKVIANGDNLITQGEEGDNFYVVRSGQFDIFVTRGSPPETKKVLTCKEGAIFGQLALLYNAPRAATCTAIEESEVWALDRNTFRNMLISEGATQAAKYEDFVSGVEVFSHLNHYEKSQVASVLDSQKFDANTDIVCQGDAGDGFFLLEAGSCSAFISGEEGEKEVKKYEKPGEYFGEIALLTAEPRKATVRAGESGCSVLVLKKDNFERLLGPLHDTMQEHMDMYPKYQSFLSG